MSWLWQPTEAAAASAGGGGPAILARAWVVIVGMVLSLVLI